LAHRSLRTLQVFKQARFSTGSLAADPGTRGQGFVSRRIRRARSDCDCRGPVSG
jgi:hypothetical protein